MAVRRMTAAGAVPLTWLAVISERQRDGARLETAGKLADVLMEHGGAAGIAYAWEVQFLGTAAKAGA